MRNGKKRKIYRFNIIFYLNRIFSTFSRSKVIITDRLHGMIFAAITGTPAIILTNSNHKVKGVYEWIKHCDYIKYISNINNFISTYNELQKNEINHYNLNEIRSQFEPLLNVIRSEVD